MFIQMYFWKLYLHRNVYIIYVWCMYMIEIVIMACCRLSNFEEKRSQFWIKAVTTRIMWKKWRLWIRFVSLYVFGLLLCVKVEFWVLVFQELDESGAEIFTLLLPSGTPLPARRHCVLSGDGKLSSVCMNIYQKLLSEQPQQLAKVQINQRWNFLLQPAKNSSSNFAQPQMSCFCIRRCAVEFQAEIEKWI